MASKSTWKETSVEYFYNSLRAPRHHKYRKLLKRSDIKISFCCMLYMASVIQSHNPSLLKYIVPTDITEYSCHWKLEYPLDQKCLPECLVYNDSVDTLDTNEIKLYYGTCKKNFKDRYNKHTASFWNKSKEKGTEFSKYIWELKNNNIPHNSKWCIMPKARLYLCGSRKCSLCFTEKLTIIKADPESLLNTRDELVSTCKHMDKFTLKPFLINNTLIDYF